MHYVSLANGCRIVISETSKRQSDRPGIIFKNRQLPGDGIGAAVTTPLYDFMIHSFQQLDVTLIIGIDLSFLEGGVSLRK